MAQKELKDKHFIQKPEYPGGLKALRQYIKDNLKYPKKALADKVEGTVSLRYTINPKGKVIEVKVIAGLGSGCDEEAVRLVKTLQFTAAKNRKLKALFHKNLQIHFRLPKTQAKKQSASIQYAYTKNETKSKKQTNQKPTQGGSYNYTIQW